MPFKNNPGCNCCEPDPGCCQVIDVKPLPTMTVVDGVATYSDTTWNGSYVTGVSGTDNTVPANTTLTINVPIGCTDYVVDVEVLDDKSNALTGWGNGMRIKVGDCLQAECDKPAVSGVQDPTIISQHEVAYVDRDYAGTGLVGYGDNYMTYRFSELFTHGTMISKVRGDAAPDYRSGYYGGGINDVYTSRHPHDAQGLTVQITIETKDDDIEIGLVRVTSGHRMCSEIADLNITPTELCQTVFESSQLYTVRDPMTELTSVSGGLQRQYVKTGSEVGEFDLPGCETNLDCSYEYTVTFGFDHFDGAYPWQLVWDGGALPAGRAAEIDTYLQKCTLHNWQHNDRLYDWTSYLWKETQLDTNFTLTSSLTITGDCDIVVPSAADEITHMENFVSNYLYPSNGIPFFGDLTDCASTCQYDMRYCGATVPQVYRSWGLSGNPPTEQYKSIDLITSRASVASVFTTPSTWPQAKSSIGVIKTTTLSQTAYTDVDQDGAGDSCCYYDTTVYTGYEVTRVEDCVAGKIAMYNPQDDSADYPDYQYQYIGGDDWFGLDHGIPTRDKQLSALSLYIADEDITFEAETGLVMRYTKANTTTYRPDYETCNCDCTADELYLGDLTNIGSGYPPCNYFHRMMQFSDGSETWYLWWSLNEVYPYDKINVYLRRLSDCKEIEFLNISDRTWPDTSGSVTKTGSNSDGDTISVTFHA